MSAYLPANSVIVNPGYQKMQNMQSSLPSTTFASQSQSQSPYTSSPSTSQPPSFSSSSSLPLSITQIQQQQQPVSTQNPNFTTTATAATTTTPLVTLQSQLQPQPQPMTQQIYTNAQPYIQQSQFPQFQYGQPQQQFQQQQHRHHRQVEEQRQEPTIQMTSSGQYIPTYPTGYKSTQTLYNSRAFVTTSQAMKLDIDPNVKSEKIWEHRTILYSKDDFAFYFSEYGSLTAFWFLTWLGCLLAYTNTTLMNTINGEFWAAIVAACIAFAMIFILICINQVEHTGPVALIVFLIYWACFSFVVMYLTAWLPTWVIFQIISLLFGTSLTLLIALLITSFTGLEDMKATALGGLVILYTLIILICALTASSESAVTILMATIVELAVAAWMVWDANNIAAKRYALMLVLDRSRMAPIDKMLDDAMDATSGSLRLFMNLIGSPLFFIDLCDQNSEKKKEEKKRKEEERKKNKKNGQESDTESDEE